MANFLLKVLTHDLFPAVAVYAFMTWGIIVATTGMPVLGWIAFIASFVFISFVVMRIGSWSRRMQARVTVSASD